MNGALVNAANELCSPHYHCKGREARRYFVFLYSLWCHIGRTYIYHYKGKQPAASTWRLSMEEKEKTRVLYFRDHNDPSPSMLTMVTCTSTIFCKLLYSNETPNFNKRSKARQLFYYVLIRRTSSAPDFSLASTKRWVQAKVNTLHVLQFEIHVVTNFLLDHESRNTKYIPLPHLLFEPASMLTSLPFQEREIINTGQRPLANLMGYL